MGSATGTGEGQGLCRAPTPTSLSPREGGTFDKPPLQEVLFRGPLAIASQRQQQSLHVGPALAGRQAEPGVSTGWVVGPWLSWLGLTVYGDPWTLPGTGTSPPGCLLTFGLQPGAQASATLHPLESGPGDRHDSHCPAPLDLLTVSSSREPGRLGVQPGGRVGAGQWLSRLSRLGASTEGSSGLGQVGGREEWWKREEAACTKAEA